MSNIIKEEFIMKKQTKSLIATLTLLIMLPFMMIPTSATTPEFSLVEGKSAVGIVGLDMESPVVLEKTTLTFDIQEYPTSYIDYLEGNFTPDKSRVSVKYDLYNPTDEEITVRLALPFTTTYRDYIKAEIEDYSVAVNGEEIDPAIRHSFHYNNAYFDMRYDPEYLHNDYLTHAFVTPETRVKKYTYEIECDELNDNRLACIGTDVFGRKSSYVYLSEGGKGINPEGKGRYRLYRSIGSDTTVEVYVIGNDSFNPTWTIYKSPSVQDTQTLKGSVSLINIDEMTWSDFVFAQYDESLGICEMDWYNAYMYYLNEDPSVRPIVSFFESRNNTEMADWFMGWYRWDIVLAPGERASTEATLPIHPEIQFRYEPDMFNYYYTLPHQYSWAQDGVKEIRINTPLYLHKNGADLGEYTKTDEGYSITLTDELFIYREYTFTLCESENPRSEGSSSSDFDGVVKPSLLNRILDILLFPFKLIYKLIQGIVGWFK